MDLGKVGIWWSGTWRVDDAAVDVAAEMESLGYTALWSSGGFQPGLTARFQRLLAATTRVAVASGIVSIWTAEAKEIASAVADLDATYPGRFLLGIGASHAPMVGDYSRPYGHVVSYLDALDATGLVPENRRVLAALGPRMLELAGAPRRRGPPVFRTRRTHGPGRVMSLARVPCSPPRSPWFSSGSPPERASWPGHSRPAT
jgi:probable F420-dependent oxidoreductase